MMWSQTVDGTAARSHTIGHTSVEPNHTIFDRYFIDRMRQRGWRGRLRRHNAAPAMRSAI